MGYVELQYQLTQEGMTVEQVDYLESDARFSLALQVTAINLAIAGIKVIGQITSSEHADPELESQTTAKTGNKINGHKHENAQNIEKKMTIDSVFYPQSSLDKAFAKHRNDFGNYPDGSNISKTLFQNDINSLLANGLQKKGTYRSTPGIHVYHPATLQWVFYRLDGSFVTAFRLSLEQYKYLIETGVVK